VPTPDSIAVVPAVRGVFEFSEEVEPKVLQVQIANVLGVETPLVEVLMLGNGSDALRMLQAVGLRSLGDRMHSAEYAIRQTSKREAELIKEQLFEGTWIAEVSEAAGVEIIEVDQPKITNISVTCRDGAVVPPGVAMLTETDCECGPGYAYEESNGKCDRCQEGFYKDEIGDRPCSTCQSGRTTLFLGANSSDACACDLGSYEVNGDCYTCPQGSFCSMDGIQECETYRQYTTTVREGSTRGDDCVCIAGYWLGGSGTLKCLPCLPGLYKPGLGNDNCENVCFLGATSSLGATERDDCFCEEGTYFDEFAEFCEDCPLQGLECPGNFTIPHWNRTHQMPYAKSGHYMIHHSLNAPECLVTTSEGESVCPGGDLCADNHAGFLCGDCRPGFARDAFPQPCERCPPKGELLYSAVLAGSEYVFNGVGVQIVALLSISAVQKEQKIHSALIRSFQNFMATVSVLTRFDLSRVQIFEWSKAAVEREHAVKCQGDAAELDECEDDEQFLAMFDFSFPEEVDGAMKELFAIRGKLPQFASVQVLLECSSHWVPVENKHAVPAMYWCLCFIPLTVILALVARGGMNVTGVTLLLNRRLVADAGEMARIAIIEGLRPKIAPMLSELGLIWDDITLALDLVKSVGELGTVAEDPAAFLAKAAPKMGPAGKKIAIALIRLRARPYIESRGLVVEDVVRALEAVDSLDDLCHAAQNPVDYLQFLASTGGPAGNLLTIALIRPKAQSYLAKHGLEWTDVLPVLDLIDARDQLQAALQDPVAFMERLATETGPAGKKLLLAMIRPKAKAFMAIQGLEWTDVLPALDLIDARDQLQAALQDPAAFLERLATATGPAGKKLILAMIRPKAKAFLAIQGLEWTDVLPALDLIDSRDQLQAALQDPAAFLERLATETGPAGKKLLLAMIRPKAQPFLASKSLDWADVRPSLELIDARDQLQDALQDPAAFLERLATLAGPAGKRLMIAMMRPKAQVFLASQGLQWAEVLPSLELIQTRDELQDALQDPAKFFERLVTETGPAGKKLLLAMIRPKAQPFLASKDLEWADVLPALEMIQTRDRLQAALNDPATFLERLATETGPSGKRLLIAMIHPKAKPLLARKGLEWADVRPALELIETRDQLQAALQDPARFLERLATETGPSGKMLLIAMIRPKALPFLKPRGIEWEDVVDLLQHVDGYNDLQTVLRDPVKFFEKLMTEAGPVGKKFLIAMIRPQAQAYMKARGLEWADVASSLDLMDLDHLQLALEEPVRFFETLAEATGPAGKKWLIAKLRSVSEIQAYLMSHDVVWTDVASALEHVEISDLQTALTAAGNMFEKIMDNAGLAAKKLLIAMIRPKVQVYLELHGLAWEDVVSTLESLDTCDALRSALDNPGEYIEGLVQQGTQNLKRPSVTETIHKIFSHVKRDSLAMIAAEFAVLSGGIDQGGGVSRTTFIMVLLYMSWAQVTERILYLIECEPYEHYDPDIGQVTMEGRWMAHPDVLCSSEEHGEIMFFALLGLAIWSTGIIVGIFLMIYRLGDERQKVHNLLRYGYFYQGFEPDFWWWEIVVKRGDVLIMTLVTYTNFVPDQRAKLIWYTLQSGFVLAFHNYYKPMDERRAGLLDLAETLGLLVRFITFGLIAVLLIFNAGQVTAYVVACAIFAANLAYFGFMGLHIVSESMGNRFSKDEKSEESHTCDPRYFARVATKYFRQALSHTVGYVIVHVKGVSEQRILRLSWRGVGHEALFLEPIPSLSLAVRIPIWIGTRLYGLDHATQRSAIIRSLSDFTVLMAESLRVRYIPGNTFDLIFFLTICSKELCGMWQGDEMIKKMKELHARLREWDLSVTVPGDHASTGIGPSSKAASNLKRQRSLGAGNQVVLDETVFQKPRHWEWSPHDDSPECNSFICADDICEMQMMFWRLTPREGRRIIKFARKLLDPSSLVRARDVCSKSFRVVS